MIRLLLVRNEKSERAKEERGKRKGDGCNNEFQLLIIFLSLLSKKPYNNGIVYVILHPY